MPAAEWEGEAGPSLARRLNLPRVLPLKAVSSTMDVASELAADGAPAGTLVIADTQSRGRGRGGRRWASEPGAGIWCTLLERVRDTSGLEVLSLRIGLGLARSLDRFAPAQVGLKWPNDLYLQGGKLGGILVESRWRGTRPEWTAIGIGINCRSAVHPGASSLGAEVSRLAVLEAIVPAVRGIASARGPLTARELVAFGARDVALGRDCVEPGPGRVAGVAEDGALLVDGPDGIRRYHDGSLTLAGDW
jgi:BirA family biotin operon repressor/biotin-[acetyl-CoA-carboxylase] ligase